MEACTLQSLISYLWSHNVSLKSLVKNLATTYTVNQTWAIASLLASVLFGLTATGVNIMTGIVTSSTAMAYAVLVIIAWILVPLYAKLVRLAFIVGIILNIIAMIGVAASPAATPWYAFVNPVYNFSFIVWYLIMLAGVYFSYKSYQELKK